MFVMYILYILPVVFSEKIIKNIDFPACKNCIHYNPNLIYGYSSEFSRCNNFGEKNIITNEIDYEYVKYCRSNELKCGKEGKYFVEDPNLNVKIVNFNVRKSFNYGWPILSLIIIIILNGKLNR
jgi:hypothetical protein